MTRTRYYFTLIQRDEEGRFYPDFGDYDKQVVADEMQDRLDSGAHRSDIAIIRTVDDQTAITGAVAHYNAKHADPGRKACDGGLDPTWLR